MPLDSDDRQQIAVFELLAGHPFEEPEWLKIALAKLVPTPGYERSFTEIEAELYALGLPVPAGVSLLAYDEQHDGLLTDGPLRLQLNG
jgi:hypothetical protein